MPIRKLFILFFLFIIIDLLLHSCKSCDTKDTEDQLGFTTEPDPFDSNLQNQPRAVYYRFPSAKEMFTYIKRENHLKYRTDLVNPTNNYSKYIDTKSKLLNLGVYMSDLSYMILFKKTSKATEYIDAIYNLSNDLRINIPFENEFLNRIKKNLNNEDSIISISDQYTEEVIDYLVSNNQEKTIALISIGSYIEGLYIALNLIEDYSSNISIIQRITDQKYAFENLSLYLTDFKNDKNVIQSIIYLNEILKIFNEIKIVEQETELTRDSENKLVIGGGKKLIISENQYNRLKSVINDLRNQITSNKN